MKCYVFSYLKSEARYYNITIRCHDWHLVQTNVVANNHNLSFDFRQTVLESDYCVRHGMADRKQLAANRISFKATSTNFFKNGKHLRHAISVANKLSQLKQVNTIGDKAINKSLVTSL